MLQTTVLYLILCYNKIMDTINFIQTHFLLIGLLALWTLPWKGVALWKSARLRDKWWFIILLIINTLGILEILYIFIFSKRASLAFNNPAK
jgi:hypothetical protein